MRQILVRNPYKPILLVFLYSKYDHKYNSKTHKPVLILNKFQLFQISPFTSSNINKQNNSNMS